MGYDIKQLKNGKFKIKSTISDESYHPDKNSITLDEAKVILINEKFWKFIEDVIEIDMEFPNGYYVNGHRMNNSNFDFGSWKMDALKSDDTEIKYTKKFEEIYKRLNLDFKI
jgi:hypothetical protein